MSDPATLNKSVSLSSASHDFVLLAKSLAAAGGDISQTQHLARTVPSMRVREVLTDLKSAVNPMSLSNSSALAPYAQLATGFFGSLAAFSAFSKIYNANDFTRVPLRTIIAVLTTAPVAEAVSELSAKPFASGSFATATLDTQKVSAIIAITNELAKSAAPSALSMLGNELRRAAGIAVDVKWAALLAATPGITSAATTGVTSTTILADLTARLNALTIGSDSRLWWIVSPKLYKTVSLVQGTGGFLMQGGKIGLISVAPSDALTTTAFLIDAKGIAAELDAVRLDTTDTASIQLDSDPTSGAYQLVNLFQINATGLRCEVEFGSVALRSTSVTMLTGYAA